METGNLNALDKHRILPERPTLMRLFGKTLFKNNTFQLGHVLPELSNEIQQVRVDVKEICVQHEINCFK